MPWPGYVRKVRGVDPRAGTQLLYPQEVPPHTQMWGDRIITVSRQVDGFKFWKARLLILEETFNCTAPRTICGFRFDKRNKREYFTFWFAGLSPVFVTTGLIFAIGAFIARILQLNAAQEANRFASIAAVSTDSAAGTQYLSGQVDCCCLTMAYNNETSTAVVLDAGRERSSLVQATIPSASPGSHNEKILSIKSTTSITCIGSTAAEPTVTTLLSADQPKKSTTCSLP